MEAVKHAVDKSGWERGPWDDEPDQESFTTNEGLHASIVRPAWSGNLCGYVGVPASHPWHGKEYGALVKMTEKQASTPIDPDRISIISVLAMAMSENEPDEEARIDCVIRVHGGLTYSGAGRKVFGEDSALWYFGFDCAHGGDKSPAYSRYGSSYEGTYRDIDYVRNEIASLSKQLAEVVA
ncbi:hypothetical protein [Massilia timonae]|uniref:hypothetical protein n=1 Tax=Massilia timonae TaxID=47229 RepID=UPI0028AAC3DE|nr:hypothetical protein [Massilia timonae]